MGRGGRKPSWQPWKEEGNEYKLWRGSWSPSLRADPAQRPWHKQAADSSYQFPAYTAMQPPSQDRTSQLTIGDGGAAVGRAHGVQALLNPARRAEQKLQRLQTARAKIEAQFGLFLKGLKKSFQKELSRFQSDTERIDQAIQEARQEQERSFTVVRNAICGTATAMSVDQQETIANGLWEQMRSTWEQEDGSFLQEILARSSPTPGQPQASAPRALSAEAQQLLAHFGATDIPAPATMPTPAEVTPTPAAPTGTQPVTLNPELMQLLAHFGAVGILPVAATSSAPGANPGQSSGTAMPTGDLGGLDPSLFGPCAGVSSEAILGGEGPVSANISPGAKARRALAPGTTQRKPVKALTKPAPAPSNPTTLGKKLAEVREAALLRDTTQQEAARPTDGQVMDASRPPEGTGAPAMSAGPNIFPQALRPFGRPPGLPATPVELVPPGHGSGGSRAVPIFEAESEGDLEELQDADD